jgi:hypothetical protein
LTWLPVNRDTAFAVWCFKSTNSIACLQVVHFLEVYQHLLNLKRPPPLSDLEAALFDGAASSKALRESGVALASLLIRDIYHVSMEEFIDSEGDEAQQKRDLQGGGPVVDEDTWSFAAAAIFAGV